MSGVWRYLRIICGYICIKLISFPGHATQNVNPLVITHEKRNTEVNSKQDKDEL